MRLSFLGSKSCSLTGPQNKTGHPNPDVGTVVSLPSMPVDLPQSPVTWIFRGTIPSQACLCCSFTQQEPEIQNSGLAGTKSPNLTACTGSRARLADFEPRSSKSLTVNSPFSEAYDLDTKTASPESCSGDCMSLLTVSHSGHFLCSR